METKHFYNPALLPPPKKVLFCWHAPHLEFPDFENWVFPILIPQLQFVGLHSLLWGWLPVFVIPHEPPW